MILVNSNPATIMTDPKMADATYIEPIEWKTVEKIIKESVKQKIKYLTLYAFSTENWKRPKKEINYLFNLLESFLINRIE